MSYRPKRLKTSVDEAARTFCCSNKSWLIMVDLYPCPTLQRFNALSSLIKHLRYECLSSTSFMTLNNSERPSLRILRVRDCGVQSLNQFSSILVVFVDPKTAMLPPSLLSLLLECSSKLHCSQTPQAPILHVARPKQQSSLLSILSSIFFLWFHGSMTVQYCPIALYNVFIMTCRSWCWVHTGIRLPEACTEPDDFRCFSERTR